MHSALKHGKLRVGCLGKFVLRQNQLKALPVFISSIHKGLSNNFGVIAMGVKPTGWLMPRLITFTEVSWPFIMLRNRVTNTTKKKMRNMQNVFSNISIIGTTATIENWDSGISNTYIIPLKNL